MSIKRYQTDIRMSQMTTVEGLFFLSGQVADGNGVVEQTENLLQKIDALLVEGEIDKSHILSINIWLANIQDFERMNSVWDKWCLKGHAPARACVESKLADPRFKVEMSVIAFKPEP